MAKALLIYGSTTGNTESAAQTIAGVLAEENVQVTIKEVTNAKPADLNGDYDLYLLGSSTWGDEEIELQEDFAEFYEAMNGLDLSDKKMAVFGCGDSSYTHFCGAVDAIEQKAEDLGAVLVAAGLKIDGDPDDSEQEILDWAQSVAAAA